jgi:hypothetical protein
MISGIAVSVLKLENQRLSLPNRSRAAPGTLFFEQPRMDQPPFEACTVRIGAVLNEDLIER